MRKKLLGLSLILTILELVSLSCSTPPKKPEKPLLEPAKQLGTAEPEKKPAPAPEEKPKPPKKITLEEALNDANLRPQHINQMPLSEYIQEAFYFDTQEQQRHFGERFKEAFNPTYEDAQILTNIIRNTNYTAITVLPTRFTGMGRKSFVIVFPRMYRSVRNQDEAELILVDQLGQHAEDNANGIVVGNTIILPEISTVKEAPEGKQITRVSSNIYMRLQNIRAAYEMLEAIKEGKRNVSRYCRQCVEGTFLEQYLELELNYVAPVEVLIKKGADPKDIKPEYLNRARSIQAVLKQMDWGPARKNGAWYVAKRK